MGNEAPNNCGGTGKGKRKSKRNKTSGLRYKLLMEVKCTITCDAASCSGSSHTVDGGKARTQRTATLHVFLAPSLQTSTFYHYQSQDTRTDTTSRKHYFYSQNHSKIWRDEISCGWPLLYSKFHPKDQSGTKLHTSTNTDARRSVVLWK